MTNAAVNPIGSRFDFDLDTAPTLASWTGSGEVDIGGWLATRNAGYWKSDQSDESPGAASASAALS